MFESIKGKKVLITGASSGIGAETAKLFASYGAHVGIHYNKNEENAIKLQKDIKDTGGIADVLAGDLLEESTRSDLVQSFIDTFGRIDVLVNNAGGVIGNKPFLELDEISWRDTMALNATAPFFLSKNAFLFMKDHGGGRIINISSISAKYGGSMNTMHYGAAKAALETLTKGFAKAGAPHNILVNCIRGGVIDTPLHSRIERNNSAMEKRISLIPLKRMGKPVDIARLALFLASEAGDFITGEIFTVAGGD